MATHSSILAREIPWTEDSGKLPFMGSQKSLTWSSVWVTTLTICIYISSMSFHGLVAYFFSVLNYIPLPEYTTVYLYIHLLKNVLVAFERLLLNHAKTSEFLASRGEEFNPGRERRLDHSELLHNKVLLKYKGDRESFWHRHQKGVERVSLC